MIPRKVNGSSDHKSVNSSHRVSLLCLIVPNHTHLVFSMFGFSPEYFENCVRSDSATRSELSEPSNIKAVSSAYWIILSSRFAILIHFTSLLFLISMPRISTHKRKM